MDFHYNFSFRDTVFLIEKKGKIKRTGKAKDIVSIELNKNSREIVKQKI